MKQGFIVQHLRPSMTIVSLIALSACGGGGGSTANSAGSVAAPAVPAANAPPTQVTDPTVTAYAAAVAPPTGYVVTPESMQPVRSANDTSEYRQNFTGNEMVNALYAADHGWTGKGVTVGVIDDGVNTALSAFQNQISSVSKDFGYLTTNGIATKRDVLGDTQSNHGTEIAGIIAARADGIGTEGLAPDAKIAILRTSDYNADTKVETMFHDAEALEYAATAGIKVINRSLVSNGAGLADSVTRYGATGGLLVNAAGNNAQANPGDTINVNDANRATWLFVVALNPDLKSYTLASYSNQAGSMADRTVAAIGTNTTVGVDGSSVAISGTSSATPQVSALAALILSKWPQLSGQQAGNVILSTARDIGAPGVDSIYGHGLIDVQAALSPSNPTISNGSTATSLAASAMAVPAAIGTGSIQTALSKVTVIDAYGRDFTGSVASLIAHPETGQSRWLGQRVNQMASGGSSDVGFGHFRTSFGYASFRTGPADSDVRSVMTAGEVSYRNATTGVRVGFNAQDSMQNDIMGLAPFADGILSYAPQAGNSVAVDHLIAGVRLGVTMTAGSIGRSRAQASSVSVGYKGLSVRASYIDESGSVFGTISEGGLALGRGATTTMLEAHQTLNVGGGWNLEGYGSVGVTRLKIDASSVVTAASSLVGTRMGLQASGPAFGGLLSFGVAQPLTIERGTAHLTIGTGYDAVAQSLTYGASNADLASDKRRLELTTGFARQTGNSTFRIGLMKDVADGTQRVLAGYRLRF
ncbi:MAG: Peptidase and in, kexin,sedolisin [Sphingomonadales bacterium]|nr:Peptidase and in, kexin,sedolisin [Sphingomonadales bacterium]